MIIFNIFFSPERSETYVYNSYPNVDISLERFLSCPAIIHNTPQHIYLRRLRYTRKQLLKYTSYTYTMILLYFMRHTPMRRRLVSDCSSSVSFAFDLRTLSIDVTIFIIFSHSTGAGCCCSRTTIIIYVFVYLHRFSREPRL